MEPACSGVPDATVNEPTPPIAPATSREDSAVSGYTATPLQQQKSQDLIGAQVASEDPEQDPSASPAAVLISAAAAHSKQSENSLPDLGKPRGTKLGSNPARTALAGIACVREGAIGPLPGTMPEVTTGQAGLAGTPSEETAKAAAHWEEYRAQDDSPVTDLFAGQLQSSVTCHQCGARSTKCAATQPRFMVSASSERSTLFALHSCSLTTGETISG